ncbi:Lsr2 family protein [Kibdelosporangium lantanae]
MEMAQKVTVELVDDLDGTVAEDISTVTFGLDGVAYEIDLTVGNAEKLRKLLDDFVGGARRTGGRAKRPASVQGAVTPTAAREQTKAIRDWARQNGYQLSDRGRISSNVIEAFDAAHKGKKGRK